jgi:hypothetical protein
MGSGFNIARGTQFLTPILIALITTNYGSGLFIGSIFALSVAISIWIP